MKKSNLILGSLFSILLITSCSDETSPVEPERPIGDYENGYFVTNEGPFQNGSGSITYVSNDGVVAQNVYSKVNSEVLGNIVNSMHIADGIGYIVVNNSHKVVAVNRYTMEKIADIEGFYIDNPRFFAAADGKGYISNWGDPLNPDDDFIAMISLETFGLLNMIPVGEGPERLLLQEKLLYVCLQGGYGNNNKVVVIDTNDNSVAARITVGDAPNSIVSAGSGDVWVLCGGSPSWTGNETPGTLYRIESGSYRTSFREFALEEHPSLLSAEQNMLYYHLNGAVYRMGASDLELPVEAIGGISGFFYTMEVKDGQLYTTDAGDYASEGKLQVYNTGSGTLLETIDAGIVPGNIVFP